MTTGRRSAITGLGVTDYRIGVPPAVSRRRYAAALSRKLGPSVGVHLASEGVGASASSTSALVRALTELIAVLAGLGVLSSVLIATRERIHDLGIFKALGMTPRQTLIMVICTVIPPPCCRHHRVPSAIGLHIITVREIGALTGSGMATGALSVYQPAELLLLALSGLAIAVVGGLLPGQLGCCGQDNYRA